MRLLIALTLLLLGTPQAAAPDACTCSADDGRAVCIGKDSGLAPTLRLPVTLELRAGSYQQLSAELSRIAGREILFPTSQPDEPINLDIKNAPLWDVLETLSRSGKVQIAGRDFAKLQETRRALAGGEKVSVCIDRVPVGQVVSELSGLSGQRLRVRSGDEKALVNLSAKGLTLEGIISRLSAQTGAQIGAK